MKLTDEQRIRVMMLVKEGKLTVDQAMDKVLKVEEEIAALEQKVRDNHVMSPSIGSLPCRSHLQLMLMALP